jgi:hypothetical protein
MNLMPALGEEADPAARMDAPKVSQVRDSERAAFGALALS